MPITLEFAHTVGGILRKVPKGAKITDTICEPNPTRGISQLVHCAVCYAAKGGTGSWWRSNSSTQQGIVAFWTWFESVEVGAVGIWPAGSGAILARLE